MITTARPATNKAVKTVRRLTFLNAPIVTAPGVYNYEILTPQAARKLLTEFQEQNREICSAVGHEATAEVMTRLLKFPVKFNRVEFTQKTDDVALVFKLKKRAPEGTVLCCEELEAIGYELGLLTRLS
jgi:hypothetical protein